MSDIDLYQNSADTYESLQMKRPDYVGARSTLLDFGIKYLHNKKEVTLADFCCGIGNNTKLLAAKIPLKEGVLIDINKEFLVIAKNSHINASKITLIQSDVLDASELPSCDAIISMFAYHHVPDSQKEKYLQIAKENLKKDGILLWGEIYSPSKETTLKYYEHLLSFIKNTTPELEKFLCETAESDTFEYKVSRQFAHSQLQKIGFEMIDSKKIWPIDATFSEDVGTFVEIWKYGNISV